MLRFDRTALQEGDLLKRRNEVPGQDDFARLIRAGTHSYSDHDGMVIHDGMWFIGEAVTPFSKLTSLSDYEAQMDAGMRVRIYRLKQASFHQRKAMAHYFRKYLIGLPYPSKSRMVLLASRLFNMLYDNIDWLPPIFRLTWCSQLVARAMLTICHDILDGPDGKKKRFFTPKTFENRILQGIFVDVTDDVLKEQA